MKTKLLIVLTTIVFVDCSKDKFNTKPSLEFKKVNSQIFHQGDIMEFVLHYTDKEGDIQNHVYVEEVTQDTLCPGNNFSDNYDVPQDVPETANSEGDIVIRYSYRQVSPSGYPPFYTGPTCQRNDTCVIKFALIDKANNSSDTITSPQLVLSYP